MKEDTYVIQAEDQQPIKIEFEGPVINRVDISFPEPVLVLRNTEYPNSERRLHGDFIVSTHHMDQDLKSGLQSIPNIQRLRGL